jgi:hypothetical protein
MYARHEYLKDHIPGEVGPLPCFTEWTEADAQDLIKEVKANLRTGVVRVFQKIRMSFERQKTRKENDSPQGQQFRKDLHLRW